ncbi:MAG: bifunctional demethylmenaquinone methyltransferase/2-methoxy-6-polyprenyl-1,4-benzoquinol methylase UbiE [Rhodospirillales bacterium]
MEPENASESTPESTTHFGFRDVPEGEKAKLVRGVFDSVAARYDIMNDLMSGGVHRLWKASFLDQVRPRAGEHLLDVGGGTGDIAFGWLKRGGGPVTLVDINAEMLSVGRDRAIDKGLLSGLDWVNCDAEALPLPANSFDAYTIAFCIRNVTHIEAVLAEAFRALKPGGRFLCLEFSRVAVPGLDKLYDTYSFQVLPRLGQWVAADREAYQYLAESIRRFPPQKTFANLIRQAGFVNVKYRNLSGGIAAVHSGWKA